jgi:hypothetical protein
VVRSGAMLPLEGTLLEKLRKIEALHAGTKVDGEREAARRAAEKIRARLAEIRSRERDEVFQYRLQDPWKRKLFVALCRRAPTTFQKRTLWPEFLALSEELDAHLQELTDRVIREAINEDVSEATEAASPKALPESVDDQGPSAATPEEGENKAQSPT